MIYLLFRFLKMDTLLPGDQVYFYEFNYKKSASKLSLFYHRALKKIFYFVLFLNICLGPQIGQNGFWIGERPKNCFSFLFFTFKQTKKHILIQMQPLKMLNRQNLCTFWVKLAKIFWSPALSPALSQKEILQWGSYNNLAQHEMFPVFFLQKSLHPTA